MNKMLFTRLNARRAASALAIAMTLSALGLVGCANQDAAGTSLSDPENADVAAAVADSAEEGDASIANGADDEGDAAVSNGADDADASSQEQAQAVAIPDGDVDDSADVMGEEPPALPGDDQLAEGTGGDSSAPSDGERPADVSDGQVPAGAPDGQAPDSQGEPPAKPDGQGGFDASMGAPDNQSTDGWQGEGDGSQLPNDKTPGGQGGPGQGSSEPNSGTGATSFSADATEANATYESSETDVSAIMVDSGASVSLSDITVTKTGDSSSSEDSDFYGLNAGVVATDGSHLTIDGASVTTDAKGANGVFAYGEGTEVTVSNSQISTSQGNSGGIEVSGGAILVASDLTVETQGQSSAAIRSDRGGGTETVTGGAYTTHGTSSPAIYSTADVIVSDATLLAESSEGVVIEGFNSVTLENDDITGNVNGNANRTGVVPNVMIYQSMSGDAEQGTGTFTMDGGSFKAENGTLFYVTNTSAVIDLTGVDLQNDEDLLIAAGNDGQWGKDGSNGATVDFTATDQELAGNITVDDISSLVLKLVGNTSYEGAINADGQAGEVTVDLAEGATWTLSADSYVSALTGDTAGIDLNGHALYVNGEIWSA